MASGEGKVLNHTCIPKDRVHKVAIICGDKKRFEVFKSQAKNYREFGHYLAWKAVEFEFEGEYLLLACHGVGAQPTSVIVRELIELGVKCIIRSGTSGTFLPRDHIIGHMCICYGAIRGDSTTQNDIDIAFPAVAHPDVVEALRKAADELNYATHLGICYTTDLFYRTGIIGEDPRNTYIKCGVAIEDTDNSAMFVLCNIYDIKCGAICTIDGCPFEWPIGNYGPHTDQMARAKDCMVKIALRAAADMSRKIKEEEAQESGCTFASVDNVTYWDLPNSQLVVAVLRFLEVAGARQAVPVPKKQLAGVNVVQLHVVLSQPAARHLCTLSRLQDVLKSRALVTHEALDGTLVDQLLDGTRRVAVDEVDQIVAHRNRVGVAVLVEQDYALAVLHLRVGNVYGTEKAVEGGCHRRHGGVAIATGGAAAATVGAAKPVQHHQSLAHGDDVRQTQGVGDFGEVLHLLVRAFVQAVGAVWGHEHSQVLHQLLQFGAQGATPDHDDARGVRVELLDDVRLVLAAAGGLGHCKKWLAPIRQHRCVYDRENWWRRGNGSPKSVCKSAGSKRPSLSRPSHALHVEVVRVNAVRVAVSAAAQGQARDLAAVVIDAEQLDLALHRGVKGAGEGALHGALSVGTRRQLPLGRALPVSRVAAALLHEASIYVAAEGDESGGELLEVSVVGRSRHLVGVDDQELVGGVLVRQPVHAVQYGERRGVLLADEN
ncbi:purine nucleoside phosphorylase, putative [Babesia caballi]|uniref:Purine nucleoside phosphorylase, putative n=1 Tax=Babesia caballi TaxID=5871 RepID=A0AAV4LL70_BABCB|nr:purine nucleoside phosphorylase, putative [Babesia caballi]